MGTDFPLARCCIERLLTLPRGWRGHTTYCPCGTLLILRDGEWRAA